MFDVIHAFAVLIGACFAAMMIGGSFVFGIASVCRLMNWAPVNTTVIVYDNREKDKL